MEKFNKPIKLQQRKRNPAERNVLCKSIFQGWRGGEDTGEDGHIEHFVKKKSMSQTVHSLPYVLHSVAIAVTLNYL